MGIPRKSALGQVAAFFASLRLNITLLFFAIVLVFFGTWAQKDVGIWEVQQHYFRSFITYYDFTSGGVVDELTGDYIPKTVRFRLFMPGGYLIGGLLLINLIMAPIIHFKLSWKKLGIHLIHLGIVFLMLGELFTGLTAVESRMTINEGETVNFSEVSVPIKEELALVDVTDPTREKHYVANRGMLKIGASIPLADSGITAKIEDHYENAIVAMRANAPAGFAAPKATTGLGANFSYRPINYNSREDGNPPNHPAALVTLTETATQRELGTYFLSTSWTGADVIQLGDRTFTLRLRPRRVYMPFSVTLDDFQFNRYPGSDIAKDFSSHVRITTDEDREGQAHRIWMNHPLRTNGFTLFQHSFGQQETTTFLQVVENPVWSFPYIGTIVVSIGMLWQFGYSLNRFASKSSNRKSKATAA
ncbi:cytochrome c biogenesis protein ResB [Sulfuriroseicoccus oceanibius]|uniref:Cytochrome c biogenesis protein ResB n=1 Tax=Sulfuriroseicoccus oceanibius TaxID=2707525 RepID=A0A6B3L9T8_9BACT|nr:cytochrome c biogenesis protein ResB [Sulfuriroseicoccus oceanibius]QQL46032.1 cytochrome c biogenesis protein ResB [Sulfuriroseicoccus oceanibius]